MKSPQFSIASVAAVISRWSRWRLRTLMVGIAVVAALLALIGEGRRRSTEPYRRFHAGKADYFRRLAASSRRDSEFAGRRASLGMPSRTTEGNFSEIPRLLSPGEWAEFRSKCEQNAALFDVMAEQHGRWLDGYQRSIYRPWEPTPPDPYFGSDLSR